MTASMVLQAFFSFNQAMNERLWTIIMEHLTDAQFAQTDGYSRGSILNQLVHMANAQYYWLRGLLDVPDLPELNADDYPTREAARIICQRADQEILNNVRGLSDVDLERIPGGWSQPVWVGLLQNAHHSTDHRAQVLRALHNLGVLTFEQNFAVYMEYLTPMTVQDLTERIGIKRTEWDDLLRQIPAGQMNQFVLDPWTVRDAITIITWKEYQLIEMMRKRTVIDVSFGKLTEAQQSSILEAGRAQPLPALIERHQVTHHEMLDALRVLTDDDVNSERIEGLPPDERFWKVIGAATWWSYPTFSARLRQLMENLSGQPTPNG